MRKVSQNYRPVVATLFLFFPPFGNLSTAVGIFHRLQIFTTPSEMKFYRGNAVEKAE